MSDPVPVPRAALVAGGLLLGASLLLTAFLLGRTSALPSPVPAPAPAPAVVAAAAAPPPDAGAPPPAAGPPPAPAASAPTPAPAPDPALAAYLEAHETALTTSLSGSDPRAVANAVVADALSGSTGGIDGLLASTRQAREAVAALAPPPAARAHHRHTLELLDQTIQVYGALREGIAARDLSSLSGLEPRAAALEAQARELDAETASLRD